MLSAFIQLLPFSVLFSAKLDNLIQERKRLDILDYVYTSLQFHLVLLFLLKFSPHHRLLREILTLKFYNRIAIFESKRLM